MENIEGNSQFFERINREVVELFDESVFQIDSSSKSDRLGNLAETLGNEIELSTEPIPYTKFDSEFIFSDSIFENYNEDLSDRTLLKHEDELFNIWLERADTLTGAETATDFNVPRITLSSRIEPDLSAKQIFSQGLSEVMSTLSALAENENLDLVIDRAFGAKTNNEIINRELNRLVDGSAEIEFTLISRAELKADGGFDRENNTVYLATEFLEQNINSVENISRVLLEEIGHYLDSQLNAEDSPGDEGAIFAALTLGEELTVAELSRLKIEDDSATVTIDGNEIALEQSAPTALTLGENTTSNLSQNEYSFSLEEESQLYFDTFINDSNYQWSIAGTDGTVYYSRRFSQTDGLNISNPILDLGAGDYTLSIDGGTSTSSYSFALKDINQEASSITPGSPIDGELWRESDFYQLEVDPGDRFFFDIESRTGAPNAYWSLVDPQGEIVFERNFSTTSGWGTYTLEEAGTYILMMEGYSGENSNDRGNYQFNLVDLNLTEELTIGETVESDFLQEKYSFSLEEDSQLYFDTFINDSNYQWSIAGTNGTVYYSRRFSQTDGLSISNPILDLGAGDYTLSIDGGTSTENYTFALKDINQEAETLTPGTPVDGELWRESDFYQLEVDPGDRFFFDVESRTGAPNAYWSLVNPQGEIIFNRNFSTTSGLGTYTLDEGGTYTLIVEGYSGESGSGQRDYSFNVNKIASGLTLNQTVRENIANQDQYVFSLEEDSLLYFDSLLNNSSFNWTLTDADGIEIVNQRQFNQSDGRTFAANPVLDLGAGEYLLKIDGNDTRIDYSFRLSDLKQAEDLILGQSIEGSFGEGKKTDLYKFNVEAGERYFFDYQAMSGSAYGAGSTQWRLIDPQGNEVFDQTLSNDAKNIILSESGTYTLLIEDAIYDYLRGNATSIDYSFQVEKIKPVQELTLGDTITNKLSTDSYSFTLYEDSLLYFDSLTNSSFNWSLTNADGDVVVNRRRFDQSDALRIGDPVLDLSAGEYLLKIDGSNVTSEYSFRLLDLDKAEPLALGTPIEKSFELVKGTDLYKFDLTEEGRFFFDYQAIIGSAYSTGSTQWRLIDPNGEEVFDQRFSTDAKDLTLSETGTYTLLIENEIYDYLRGNATSIDYRFRVQPIAEAKEIGIGDIITSTLETDSYSFTLDEDSLLYFDSLTNSSFNWSLTNADGDVVVNRRRFDQSDALRIGDPVLDLSAGEYLLNTKSDLETPFLINYYLTNDN